MTEPQIIPTKPQLIAALHGLRHVPADSPITLQLHVRGSSLAAYAAAVLAENSAFASVEIVQHEFTTWAAERAAANADFTAGALDCADYWPSN